MTDVVVTAHAADGRVHGVLKAIVVGARIRAPTSIPGGEWVGARFGISDDLATRLRHVKEGKLGANRRAISKGPFADTRSVLSSRANAAKRVRNRPFEI